MPPKISIITVCFNSDKTIGKTLGSIRRQDYDNIEYIVIDGASRDGTNGIIKQNQDIVTHYVSEPDRGLYDAMNKGIRLATGDYVGILNSDDVFQSPTVISQIAKFHSENPGLASVGDIVQHNAAGTTVRSYSARNWTPPGLKVGFMPPHPAIFFPRAWFQEYGDYRLDFKIGADYELIIRYFLRHGLPWKYSRITTTSMLQGGLSTAGPKIYWFVTKEIERGLDLNDIHYSKLAVRMRCIWKVGSYLNRFGQSFQRSGSLSPVAGE